ncbi:MAG: DUF885 domain-containing protein [Deltaproteobacteria bacterium]|nr:DUF885 domain-containing protein [Deltaproteobacteria bacterium]
MLTLLCSLLAATAAPSNAAAAPGPSSHGASAPGAAPAPAAWIERSNTNARLLLDLLAKYSPESASELGVDGHDEDILDLSRDTYEAERADTQAVIAELQKRLAAETDLKVRQDLDILIHTAQANLETDALERKHLLPYFDMAGLIYGVVREMTDPRIPPERQKSLVVRLEKYAGLAKGYRPATLLAQERYLERQSADPSLWGPFQGEVEQDQAKDVALIAGIRELMSRRKLPGWEKPVAALEKQLADHAAWVKANVRTRADHRLPPEVYANRLQHYGLDLPVDELVSRALTSFSEIRNQMQITAGQIARQRGFADADYRAVIRELKKEQLPADQVMPTYRARLAEIEAIVRREHIVTLPDRAARIRLASEAENAQVPAPHMNAPRLVGNTGEYGEFVLTTAMPPDPTGKRLVYDDFSHQADTWTLTAHEARPGHELQFAKIIEAGVSTARAVFAFNSVNVEGWALYAEAELQPFEPLDGQLFALQARMQRAARAFLDPMVNRGEIAPAEVVAFLREEVGLSEGMATQEMQRYVFNEPGQATSYFYGYQRLMETREAAEIALRKAFDRQAFNDFVLSQGLVPPRLLREAVMSEFVPAQKAKAAARH